MISLIILITRICGQLLHYRYAIAHLLSVVQFIGKNVVSLSFLICLKNYSSSIQQFSFNADRFLEEVLEICETNFTQESNRSINSFLIVFMLISYNHFYITNFTNFTSYVLLMFQFLLIVISIFLIKTLVFNFSFENSSNWPYEVQKYQKINLLSPKGSSKSGNMNIFSFLFISLLSFNFLGKRKMIVASNLFLLVSLPFQWEIFYESSDLRTGLNVCFICYFFCIFHH